MSSTVPTGTQDQTFKLRATVIKSALRPLLPWTIFPLIVALLAIVFSPSILRSSALASLRANIAVASNRAFAQVGKEVMIDRKYTPGEEKQWNHMADHMDQFHNYFRMQFNRVYTLADGGFHKEGMSLPRFLREAEELSRHLDMHHRIEETYIFPILAKKMPQFKAGARESGQHLESHRQIHAGLDKYDAFLQKCGDKPAAYDAPELRAILDGFRDILFLHLDEEVRDLSAPSMKAAGWTLEEIRRMPM